MGLFADLLNAAEDVGGGALKPFESLYQEAVAPTYRATVRPVAQQAYRQVIRPVSHRYSGFVNAQLANFRIHIDHPELFNPLLTGDDREAIYKRYGLSGSSDITRGAILNQRDSQERLTRATADLPGWQRTALGILADPLVELSVGSVAGAARVGAKTGLAGLLKGAGGELLAQSGLPSVAKIPYAPLAILKGGKLAQVSRLRTVVDMTMEGVKDASAAKYAALGGAERARTLAQFQTLKDSLEATITGSTTAKGIAARLKLLYTMPDVKTLDEQYGALAKTLGDLTGANLEAADYVAQAQKGRFLQTVAGLNDTNTEFNNKFVHEMAAGGTLDKLAQRIPVVSHVLNGIDPTLRARLELDPAFDAYVRSQATTEHIRQQANLMSLVTSTAARDAGLVGDPVSRLVKVKALGKLSSTVDNVFEHPELFALTAKQRDVVEGFHYAKGVTARQAKALLGNVDLGADRAALLKKLDTLTATGGEYVPRVGIKVGPPGAAEAFLKGELQPNILRRVAAAAHLPVSRIGGTALPPGFKPVQDIKSALGARQTVEFDRVLASPEEASRMLFSTDPGEMLGSYIQKVNQIVADQTITIPMLKKLGLTQTGILAGHFDREIGTVSALRDKLGKAKQLLDSISSGGTVSGRTLARMRTLAADESLPQEARSALDSVIGAGDRHLAAQQASAGAGRAVSRELGKVGRKLETAGEARARAPFEPKGTTMPRQTYIQAEPTILKGQQAQELAAQVSGERVVAEAVGRRTGLTRAQLVDEGRALKTVEQVTPVTSERLVAVREDLADIIAGRGVVPQQGILTDAKSARDALISEARVRRDEIAAHFGKSRADLDAVKAAKTTAFKGATTFDYRQAGIPALSGTWFDKETAARVSELFGPADKENLLKHLTAVQAIGQSIMAGADFSVSFMQSLAVLPASPGGWAKGLVYGIRSLKDPNVYARYLEGVANSVDLATGRSWLSIATEARLTQSGTELYAPLEALAAFGAAGSPLGKVAEFIGNMPQNRAFSIQRNVASVEMLKAQVGLEQAILGRPLNHDELVSVGRQVDLATGVVSSTKLGIMPTQATYERLLGRFGVQWFRSQTGRLVQAFQAGSIDGRLARRMLFQQAAAMTVLYAGVAEGLGGEFNFDPSSRDFMTVKLGKSRVRFGGIYPAMMKTIGQTVDAVASGDEGRLLDIKNGRNPLLNFWRNGAPVIGGIIADAVGVNAQTSYFNRNPLDPKKYLPFDVQAAINPDLQDATLLDRAIAGLATGGGLTETPQTPTDLWKTTTDQYAKEHGVADWASLPKAEQTRALRDVPELAQAEANRQAWFDRGNQTPLDVAFDQTGKSRAAMGDVLSGLWARVQSGQMTRAEWRQVYNDWSGRHAYFSENVFGSLPAEDQAKLNKDAPLLQDRLASRFAAIQPQDTTGTGTPSEEDWKAWRTARDQFWKDNPEALPFRSYIMFDYPTSRWDNPIMGAADQERRMASDQYDEYLSLPKYRGMSADEADFLDALVGAKNRAAKELTAMVVQQGADPNRVRIPAKIAWQYAVASLQQAGVSFDARRAELLKLAAVIDAKPRAKLQLIDPRRFAYLRSNPTLMDWYPGAVTATGIPQDILVRLGLIQEMPGQSLAERGAAMLQ